jgi:hypothetical protein
MIHNPSVRDSDICGYRGFRVSFRTSDNTGRRHSLPYRNWGTVWGLGLFFRRSCCRIVTSFPVGDGFSESESQAGTAFRNRKSGRSNACPIGSREGRTEGAPNRS